MSGGALLTFALMAAIWPFNRDRNEDEAGTIKDLESRVVEIDTQSPIGGSERKAIESYRLFLELSSDDPELRAEAMRRLADLQLEFVEAEQLQRNIDSLGEGFAGTAELYERLLASYPNYEKNDLVLYQLARAYEAAADPERALATLDRLVTEYPDTPHIAEAQFRRGEALFTEQRYTDAEEAYRSVLERGPQASFYEQSLYKHGWSMFKLLQHEDGLDSFFALLDRKLPGEDPGAAYEAMGRADQELVDDTLRVMSISFSYMDGPQSISEYFDVHGARPYAYVLFTSLGRLYLEQERYQDAADAYHAFVDLDPYHARAPLLQAEAVEAFRRGGFADLVLDGQRGFVERYGRSSPYWQRYSFEEQPEVVAELKRSLTDLAAFHHAGAQSSGEPEAYAEAARWYRAYLESFHDGTDAAGMNFLLAEVLFESGDHRAAALEYERTAYAYPFHERSGEAGYAALLAYARHEGTLQGAELAAWRRQGIDSALRFAAAYPEHEQAAAVQTNAAERLFDAGELQAARDAAMRVVERVPAADPALMRTALTVVGHAEFDLERYAEAEQAYSRLLAFVPRDDVQHVEIVERIASSIYKQGEQAQAGGDAYAAVDHFLRVGSAAPSSAIRATAQYDAAAALIRVGEWERAAAVLEDFRQRFPEHELASDVTANLAVAYVEVGDPVRAAGEFERIADNETDPEVAREALWRAAELYGDGDQRALAATAYQRYVERFPRPALEAVEARQRLVGIAAENGDSASELLWLEEIVAADAAAGEERTDRTRYLAAHAQLRLAEPARDAFRAARLVIPLDQSLAVKQERMERALAAYGKAADYGIAEVTTAATYEIAELYHSLGRDLIESERPPELGPDELVQYEILLEEQAFPFEEQAIGLHELNAARTADGIYDEWVRRSLDALATLVPVRYAKREIGEELVSAIQ